MSVAQTTLSVTIPSLLAHITNNEREVHVVGTTLNECLEDLFRQYPVMRGHLFENDGSLRRHVLILYGDQSTRWLESLDIPVESGETITILQAVSGG
jgi:molybdopterin converting factor small subunit